VTLEKTQLLDIAIVLGTYAGIPLPGRQEKRKRILVGWLSMHDAQLQLFLSMPLSLSPDGEVRVSADLITQ
jgi:hypothetical protein